MNDRDAIRPPERRSSALSCMLAIWDTKSPVYAQRDRLMRHTGQLDYCTACHREGTLLVVEAEKVNQGTSLSHRKFADNIWIKPVAAQLYLHLMWVLFRGMPLPISICNIVT